jgi:hypothetical protein
LAASPSSSVDQINNTITSLAIPDAAVSAGPAVKRGTAAKSVKP